MPRIRRIAPGADHSPPREKKRQLVFFLRDESLDAWNDPRESAASA